MSETERTAPDEVEQQAQLFFSNVGLIVGDRIAELRFDDDRGLRVTVFDRTDDDVAAVAKLADRMGIGGWGRVDRADPSVMETWARLQRDLARIDDQPARMLSSAPLPDDRYHRPPVNIRLRLGAEAVAAELHDKYGAFVALQVGALPYPPGTEPGAGVHLPHLISGRPTVNATEMSFELDGSLSVRSGPARPAESAGACGGLALRRAVTVDQRGERR